MNSQNTRKSCEDYIEYSRIPCPSLARAKALLEEFRLMRPELICVVQHGKTWEIVSYIYQPISNT